MDTRWIAGTRTGLAALALAFASLISLGMLAGRVVLFHNFHFTFLIWNLLLAWIPLVAAIPIYLLRRHNSPRWGLLAACALVWFIFYPNAPI